MGRAKDIPDEKIVPTEKEIKSDHIAEKSDGSESDHTASEHNEHIEPEHPEHPEHPEPIDPGAEIPPPVAPKNIRKMQKKIYKQCQVPFVPPIPFGYPPFFPFANGFPFPFTEQDYSDEECEDHEKCRGGECRHENQPNNLFNETSYFVSNPGFAPNFNPGFAPGFGPGFNPGFPANFAPNFPQFPQTAGNSSVVQGKRKYFDPKINRYVEISVKLDKDGNKIKTKRVFNPETQKWDRIGKKHK